MKNISYSDIFIVGAALIMACVIAAKWDRLIQLSPVTAYRNWRADHRIDPFSEWDEEDRARPIRPAGGWADEVDVPATAIQAPVRAAITHADTVVTKPPTDAEVFAAALIRNSAYATLSGEHSRPVRDVPLPQVMLESRPRPAHQSARRLTDLTDRSVDAYIASMKKDMHDFMVNLIGETRLLEIEAERSAA